MAVEVLLPDSVEEAVIAEWLVPDGGEVRAGQPLYALENDKAVAEIESPASGTLKILAATGQTLRFGTVLAHIVGP